MTLSGSWRWVSQGDDHFLQPSKAIGHERRWLLYSSNLEFAARLAYDLVEQGRARLAFTLPVGDVPVIWKTKHPREVPFRIKATATDNGFSGEAVLQRGQIGPRPSAHPHFHYERETRIRWLNTGYRINRKGLWRVDPWGYDQQFLVATDEVAFPRELISFLSELMVHPKGAIEDWWNIEKQCPLCGKGVVRQKMHSGCCQKLPTTSLLTDTLTL